MNKDMLRHFIPRNYKSILYKFFLSIYRKILISLPVKELYINKPLL
jgi:hypothetical protein